MKPVELALEDRYRNVTREIDDSIWGQTTGDIAYLPLTRESADMRPRLSDYGHELVAAFDEDLDATT